MLPTCTMMALIGRQEMGDPIRMVYSYNWEAAG